MSVRTSLIFLFIYFLNILLVGYKRHKCVYIKREFLGYYLRCQIFCKYLTVFNKHLFCKHCSLISRSGWKIHKCKDIFLCVERFRDFLLLIMHLILNICSIASFAVCLSSFLFVSFYCSTCCFHNFKELSYLWMMPSLLIYLHD